MIIPCTTIEQLLRRVLAHPRRVKFMEDDNVVGFKTDNGVRIYITRADLEESARGDLPHRTKHFLSAIKTEKGKYDYCESVNYGKPSWGKES